MLLASEGQSSKPSFEIKNIVYLIIYQNIGQGEKVVLVGFIKH